MSEVRTGLSIGEVVERTGLSEHTLRFYERERLLPTPVRRNSAGRRVYTESDLEWLTICTRLRSSGMPLAAIRRYADLVREGEGNEDARLALLRDHQQRVLAQIRELAACLDVINYKVGVYEKAVADGTAGTLWTGCAEETD